MAKYIKRAGIVFFATILLSLLIVSVLVVSNVKDNLTEQNSKDIVADEEFVPDITLVGKNTAIATLWKQAVTRSISENKEINVLLNSNWLAPITEETHSFGSGDGFTEFGALHIPSGAKIKLDLNGKTIDRLLTKENPIEGGHIFFVEGNLTIVDSAYDSSAARTIYNFNKENYKAFSDNILKLPIGKIQGASANGEVVGATTNGKITGAIAVMPTGTFNMYGGMILNNFSKSDASNTILGAAGIYIYSGTFNMYDGIIFNNQSSNMRGAGISTFCGTINIDDGFIVCNQNNSTWGGGIAVQGKMEDEEIVNGNLNMVGGVVSHNIAAHGTGICSIDYSISKLENEEVAYNYAEANSAGLLVFSVSAEVYVKNSKIIKNYTGGVRGDYNGGAIYCNAKLDLDGVEITDNTYMTTDTSKIIRGGGVYVRANGDVTMQNVVIARNVIKAEINDGAHAYGGGLGAENAETIKFGSNVKIYDNIAHGVPSDLRLEKGQTVNIVDNLSNSKGNSHIGIKFAEDYDMDLFTSGYGALNNVNPSEYFFANDGKKIATLNSDEVSFEKTIESEIYDFIYLENNKRQTYKSNNLEHAINDYDKVKVANSGKFIIGSILPNTSVNSFIQNINFDRTKVKLYDSNNKLIYDKGNSVTGIDSSLYDKRFELAVGTGWRLETYTASGAKIEEFSLSVLGDSNGDGRISASDIVYLRELAQNKALFNSLSVERKLACLIDNRGKFTQADAEIIKAVIEKESNIELYF